MIQSGITGCHHKKLLTYYNRDKIKPLDYVIWVIPFPNTSHHPSFLDYYVGMGPFNSKYFTVDTATVHTIIIELGGKNKRLNANVQSLMRFQYVSMG